MSRNYSEERGKLLADINVKLSDENSIENDILRDAKTQLENLNIVAAEILRFSVNGKPYHIEILPSLECRVVLAHMRKNPVLATSNKDTPARWVKHDVLTPKLKKLHDIVKDITHPCLTKNIYLSSWIVENKIYKESPNVCIEDLDDNNIKYETMPKIEKRGEILTAKQFLLIAFSLASLLKALHENNIVLGEIDADVIQLKPMNGYYFPILQKHNLTSLKTSSSTDDKKNDMKRLCKMLLGMSHYDDKKTENDPSSINALLIKSFENSNDTLFGNLNRKVISTNDDKFINNALDAAGINKTELNARKETIAKVLNKNLWSATRSKTNYSPPESATLPSDTSFNTLLTLPFLGLFFSLWNIPTQATAASEEPRYNESEYIRAFDHLWENSPEEVNDFFISDIPDAKLNALMLDAYNKKNNEKIETLKIAYKNRDISFTQSLFKQNPQCAADIAFTFWKPEDSNDLFTKFINSHILLDKAIDEKLARHVLKYHGVSTGDGKYLSTQVARNIINQRKGSGYGLQEIREGLLKIIQAIEAYESVLIRREKEELPLHYFRCHKTSERRSLCREILQNCSEATDARDLCNKLQSCINKLNKFSTLGKSKLAEKLETIQNDLNPKQKNTYFRLF